MESILTHAYLESISQHNNQNAIFLAERLHTHFPSEESTRLLAEAFLANGEFFRAYAITRGNASSANRFHILNRRFKFHFFLIRTPFGSQDTYLPWLQ